MSEFSIRPLQEKDTERMVEWLKDEDVTRYLTIGGADSNVESTLEFIQKSKNDTDNLHRAIVGENDDYLGTVSLKNTDRTKGEAEYAIAMHPNAMGTGAAAAGTKLILALAFDELSLKRIYLNVLRVNQRAVKFYYKLGFKYTHSTISNYGGEEAELVWYEVVKD